VYILRFFLYGRSHETFKKCNQKLSAAKEINETRQGSSLLIENKIIFFLTQRFFVIRMKIIMMKIMMR
jgi:hypothetical protein